MITLSFEALTVAMIVSLFLSIFILIWIIKTKKIKKEELDSLSWFYYVVKTNNKSWKRAFVTLIFCIVLLLLFIPEPCNKEGFGCFLNGKELIFPISFSIVTGISVIIKFIITNINFYKLKSK